MTVTVMAACVLMAFAICRLVSAYKTAKVHALISRIKTGDDDSRLAAANKLAKIGAPAAGPLVAALHSKDDTTWAAAAVALGRMGAPAIKPLRHVLNRFE